MMKHLGIVLSILALAATAFSEDRPNILFIAVDDLRPELGTYGVPVKTPNIDRLAATGVRFDRAYCQQAVCGASRLSIMGGLYPTKTGEQTFHVEGWRRRHPDLLTMNQHFRAQGYFVSGMGKIYHGGSGPGVDPKNWDEWQVPDGKGYALAESMAAAKAKLAANPRLTSRDVRGTTTEMADVSDDVYVDGAKAVAAAETLRRLAEKGNPFFFAVGFLKPHLPFVAPTKYWDLYDRDDFAMPSNLDLPPGYPEYAANRTAGEMSKYSDYEGESPRDFSDALNKRLLHGYAACVSYTDANIGKVLDALDETGLAENTIVVLWGDHGWKLGDHYSWCKHTNFEVDTRVPLIVRKPGGGSGETTDSLVELIDIYPTLCELTGIPTPGHVQGTSFAELLNDPETAHRDSAYSSYPHGLRIGHSIRFGDFRYTEWYEKKGNEPVARVLTDLAADPGETTNSIDDSAYSEKRASAQAILRKRIAAAVE